MVLELEDYIIILGARIGYLLIYYCLLNLSSTGPIQKLPSAVQYCITNHSEALYIKLFYQQIGNSDYTCILTRRKVIYLQLGSLARFNTCHIFCQLLNCIGKPTTSLIAVLFSLQQKKNDLINSVQNTLLLTYGMYNFCNYYKLSINLDIQSTILGRFYN